MLAGNRLPALINKLRSFLKNTAMTSQKMFQEIILSTGSRFARRDFCRRSVDVPDEKDLPVNEKLEKVCWEGLLDELLPEIKNTSCISGKCVIWQIITAENFLCICRGRYLAPISGECSIDPYHFISRQNLN